MNNLKLISTIVFSILITACNHPIEIVGEGDVTSGSGNRSCYLEDYRAGKDNCKKNTVIGAYQETYYATPRDGWHFSNWENYCKDTQENNCSFSASAQDVQKNWGLSVPPLIAVFSRNAAEAKLSMSFDPSPAPYSPKTCRSVDSGNQVLDQWSFNLSVRELNGLGVTLEKVTYFIFTKSGFRYKYTYTIDQVSPILDDCDENPTYVKPNGEICGLFCVREGFQQLDSVEYVFQGIDDSGNEVFATGRQVLLPPVSSNTSKSEYMENTAPPGVDAP